MRTRTDDKSRERPQGYAWQNSSQLYDQPGQYPQYELEVYPDRTLVDSAGAVMMDTTTPGFFKKTRSGSVLPINPASRSETIIYGGTSPFMVELIETSNKPVSGGKYRGTRRVYKAVSLPMNLPAPSSTSSWSPPWGTLQNKAIADAEDSWDIGESLAELKKSAATFAGIGRRIGRAGDRIDETLRKRKRKLSKSDYLDAFNDEWLRGRYGVRPIESDFYNAVEAFNKVSTGRILARGSSVERYSKEAVTPWTKLPNPLHLSDIEVRWRQTTEWEARAFAGVMVDGGRPAYVNVPVTMWAVRRYSFIVDMFFDVSSMIAAFQPQFRGDLRYVGRRLVTTTTSVPEYRDTGKAQSGYSYSKTVTGIDGVQTLNRIWTRENVPVNQAVTMPSFYPRVNLAQAYDLFAIARNLRRRTL